jgi:membrane protein implicated in regulation of membrane protease activity
LTAFWRYWLLQIPGWVVLVALLIAANRYLGLPFIWAVSVFVLWFLKDWALYPMLKSHYRFRTEPPSERLVGRRATAKEALRPSGYVVLRGELWLAELVSGEGPVAAGDEVTVEAVEGLTLRVKPAPAVR